MRFKKPLVGLSVAGMFALAACGGGTTSSTPDPSDAGSELINNTGGGQDPTATGPYTIEGATEGGVVHVANTIYSYQTSMDPRNMYYGDMISLFTGLITRTLTQVRYNDETGQMDLVPDLATDLGTANDDYTEWTFTLKDGITYEDGTPVTSKDIAYSVSSAIDVDTFGDWPANYLAGGVLIGSDDLKAGKEDTAYINGDKIISGIETPDDKTIIFKFSESFPDLPQYAFFPFFGPIPVGSDPATYEKSILATGPYKIEELTPGKSIHLVRNDQWNPDTDPGRAALPDEWYFDMTEADPKKIGAVIKADKGEGQTTMTGYPLDASDIQTMPEGQLVTGPQPLTRWLAPDYQTTSLEVRQAIAYAYPYAEAAKIGGSLVGVDTIFTSTLIAPGTPGRPDEEADADGNIWGTSSYHPAGVTDAEKAKQILTDAGELGFELSWLYTSDDPTSVEIKDAVVKAYKAAGFKTRPVATTAANGSADRANPDTPINIRAGGWFSDWPSGYSWIPPVFNPVDPNISCADQKWTNLGVVNYGKFCEDDVVEKIKETKTLPVEEQAAAWYELEKYIQETYYPIIPTTNGMSVLAHGTKIMGFEIDPTGGEPTWKNIWVAQ